MRRKDLKVSVGSSVFVRYPCMAINDIVQYTSGFLPCILLSTQAPILVWFDGTIIDIITILLTMYYSGYVWSQIWQEYGSIGRVYVGL